MLPLRTAVIFALSLILLSALGSWAGDVSAAETDPLLGPHSTQAIGSRRVLMVAVRFPDATPTTPLATLRQRATVQFGAYVREQSYGLADLVADFRGYVTLPDPLAAYAVSPYNFKVDRRKVRKLIEDTMTVLEAEVDFSQYDHLLIMPAVLTRPGQGYGMLCYCANPGMLSMARHQPPRYVTLKSRGGQEFSGGVFVGAENANLGMYAHDYFHALGGLHGDQRLVPCLYDYERQSDAAAGLPSFDRCAIYMGPWDIMSQHFIKPMEPPPGLSSFTKIRLGWIKPSQVLAVMPGATACGFVAPLAQGGSLLAIKIPLGDGTYYLVENRQAIGSDAILPETGLLVARVYPEATEGYGTVRVQIAGGSRDFTKATFTLEEPGRESFADDKHQVALVALWQEQGNMGVLVTTPGRRANAVRAAKAIGALSKRIAEVRAQADQVVLDEAVTIFKAGDFEKSFGLTEKALGVL